jgi:hypothetical protein
MTLQIADCRLQIGLQIGVLVLTLTAGGCAAAPSPAPITLKFIGIIESTNPAHARRIAVLRDGRNPPFPVEVGAIIEGRYRILKIGVDAIELAYVDGRGRQTIRLTGS